MSLFRRIEAYKKENRRAISFAGHRFVPCKHITRRCYESHLAVLGKCYGAIFAPF